MNTSIANIVLDRRDRLGITQEQLAQKVGKQKKTIYDIEKGNRVPKSALAQKLGNVLFEGRVKQVEEFEELCSQERARNRSRNTKSAHIERTLAEVTSDFFVTVEVEQDFDQKAKIVYEDWMSDLGMSPIINKEPPSLKLRSVARLYHKTVQSTAEILRDDATSTEPQTEDTFMMELPKEMVMPVEVISFCSDLTFNIGKYKSIPCNAKTTECKEAILTFRTYCETHNVSMVGLIELLKRTVSSEPQFNPAMYSRDNSVSIPMQVLELLSQSLDGAADLLHNPKQAKDDIDGTKLAYAMLEYSSKYLGAYIQQSALAPEQRGNLILGIDAFARKLK